MKKWWRVADAGNAVDANKLLQSAGEPASTYECVLLAITYTLLSQHTQMVSYVLTEQYDLNNNHPFFLHFNLTPIQGGPAKVRPTYIFDGNIWMHR